MSKPATVVLHGVPESMARVLDPAARAAALLRQRECGRRHQPVLSGVHAQPGQQRIPRRPLEWCQDCGRCWEVDELPALSESGWRTARLDVELIAELLGEWNQ